MNATQPQPRPLPTEFTRRGLHYRQVERTPKAAIYRVISGTQVIGHEVVRIRCARESKLPNGAIAPFRELYPSDEDFGSSGWYFMGTNLEAILQTRAKFEELHVDGATN